MLAARTLATLSLLGLGGCCLPIPGLGGGGAPAPPAPPIVGPAPSSVPAPVPAIATPTACIVGHWEAQDILELARRNMRRGLEDGTLTRASGTITVDVTPPGPGGEGDITLAANELVHSIRARSQGITVTGTHTMSGSATHPYTLPADGLLHVEGAKAGVLRSRVVAQAAGFRFSDASRDRIEFEGVYAFECTPTDLRLWGTTRTGDRRGTPLHLVRGQSP